MDFRFTPDQEAFRHEVRAFFAAEGPLPGVGDLPVASAGGGGVTTFLR